MRLTTISRSAWAIFFARGVLGLIFFMAGVNKVFVLGPVIDRLADRNEGRVTFAKVNVDENQKTAMQFGVQSIPALLFFKGGELVDRTVGALPESVIQTKLEQLLKNDAPTPLAA